MKINPNLNKNVGTRIAAHSGTETFGQESAKALIAAALTIYDFDSDSEFRFAHPSAWSALIVVLNRSIPATARSGQCAMAMQSIWAKTENEAGAGFVVSNGQGTLEIQGPSPKQLPSNANYDLRRIRQNRPHREQTHVAFEVTNDNNRFASKLPSCVLNMYAFVQPKRHNKCPLNR